MSEKTPLGRFCWYELITTDPQAAQAFYTKAIGWGTQVWEGPMPYTMWTVQGEPIGGVMQLDEDVAAQGTPAHWLAYVSTPNVEETASLAGNLGGKLLKDPQEVPEAGRFALLADPQGAVFAIYSPSGESQGHDGPAKLGEFSWHELVTTDQEAAFGFYSALFGWEKMEALDMGEMGIYQMYGRNGMPLGGMYNKPEQMPGPPSWLYYALVGDVHQVSQTVTQLGGEILNGPMEVPGGDFISQCMDPQGAAFAIHHQCGEDGQ